MREMKDSGIEWVGNIPADWSVTRIKYILDPSEFGIKCGPFGSALTGKVVSDGETVIYGQWNIVNGDFSIRRNTVSSKDATFLESYNVQPNDVLVSMMGTIGRCAIVPETIATGIMDSHVIKIRLDTSQILPQFFWYEYDKNNCNVVMEYFNRKKKGFIMDGLNTSIIKNAYLILPPIDEQCRIVSFLNKKCFEFDKLISNVHAQIEKLKAYKQSVITEIVTKGLDPTVPMKDSGVEWFDEINSLYSMQTIRSLFRIKKDIIGHEPDTVLSITQRGLRVKNINENEGQMANSYAHYQIVRVGDFAMNHMDLLTGGIGIAEIEGVTSPDYRVFVKRNPAICSKYFLYVFETYYRNKIFYAFGQGAANMGRWRLPTQNFNTIRIPVPSVDEQFEIATYLDEKCDQIDRLIAIKQAKIEKLEQYKRSLIYEYVTGKREV